MYNKRKNQDYYQSGYMDTLKYNYRFWIDRKSEAEKALKEFKDTEQKGLDSINLSAIKIKLSAMLKSYKHDRDNSWRSWRIFSDKTRDQHINDLQSQIDNLTGSNIPILLNQFNKEKKYADRNNGKRYKNTIVQMQAFITKNLPQKTQETITNYHEKLKTLRNEVYQCESEANKVHAKQFV